MNEEKNCLKRICVLGCCCLCEFYLHQQGVDTQSQAFFLNAL